MVSLNDISTNLLQFGENKRNGFKMGDSIGLYNDKSRSKCNVIIIQTQCDKKLFLTSGKLFKMILELKYWILTLSRTFR